MKVGMARGVILLAIADAGVPLIELTPNQVKQGIAGWGGADKRQVQDMVKRLLEAFCRAETGRCVGCFGARDCWRVCVEDWYNARMRNNG